MEWLGWLGDKYDSLNRKINSAIFGEWNITDSATGTQIASFSSFLDYQYTGSAEVTNYPVESGSFDSINKTNAPASVTVTLARSGNKEELNELLGALEPYAAGTALVDVVTPYKTFLRNNIINISYGHTSADGRGRMVVALTLKEIRERQARYGSVKVTRNPEMSSTIDHGEKNGKKPLLEEIKETLRYSERSILKALIDLGWGLLR